MKTFTIVGLLFLLPLLVMGQVQIGQTLSNLEPDTGFGETLRITNDGGTIAVTAPEECRDVNSTRGVTRVYYLQNNLWVQKGTDLKHNYFATGSGLAISDDGNTVVIGSTSVTQVFSFNGTDWVQKGTNIVEGGRGVDLSSDGNTISVSNRDSVVILEYVNSVWAQKGSTIIGDFLSKFGFNTRFNSDATGIIIAAPKTKINGGFNYGCAYVYEYANSDWSQKGNRVCGNDSGDYFSGGRFDHGGEKAIGISDDLGTILVSSSEVAYTKLYKFTGTNWSQVGSDLSGGFAVDISSDGSTFVTTDPYTSNANDVTVYKLNGATITSSTIFDNGCNGCNGFGSSVELSSNGEVIIISDPYTFDGDPDVPQFAGYVQAFDLTQPALPVRLAAFHATPTQKQTHLTWQTASESQNAYFHVQHAPDGQNWQDIGRVAGGGTTQAVQEYTFTHNDPVPGDNYYRLRQEDFDGTTDYSPVRQVWFDVEVDKLSVYPNPATDEVRINRPEGTGGALELSNIDGRVVRWVAAGAVAFSVADLPAGVYVLRAAKDSNAGVRVVVH